VKQLFSKSQQSLDVFLNEIVLVAAVKHRNLVKLKGCCIRKDQRVLVHEFVDVGDLEQVLFGKLLWLAVITFLLPAPSCYICSVSL
jgi:hypothetical protein